MTRSGGAPLWAVLGFQGVWKSKFEKIAVFGRPSLMFVNEIETSGGHISSTTAFGRSRLGFWMPLVSPFKNTSKLEKCQKNRGKSCFFWSALPCTFHSKLKLDASITQVPRGVGSSHVGFWMPLGSLSIKHFQWKSDLVAEYYYLT